MLIRLGFCGSWKLILGKSEKIPVASLDRVRVGRLRFSHHDTPVQNAETTQCFSARAGLVSRT